MGSTRTPLRLAALAAVVAALPALAACTGTSSGPATPPASVPSSAAGTDAAPSPYPTVTPIAIPDFGADVVSYSTLENGQLISRPGTTDGLDSYIVEGACSGEQGADVTYQLIEGDSTTPVAKGTFGCDGTVYANRAEVAIPRGRVSLEIQHITKNATEIYLELLPGDEAVAN